MAAKLTFYTYVPRNWNASFYYRIFVPFHTARDLGLPIEVKVDTNDTEIPSEDRARAFCESDIIVLYHPVSDPTFANIRRAKSFIPSKRDGAWKYPPAVVVETDDNLFHVSPYNQAYRTLGYRDHEGKELPKGHMIGTVEGGEKRLLWHDGQKGFDIARNKHSIDTYRSILEHADAVLTSVPYLEETVKEECMARRVRTFPNLVRFDHYEQPKLEQDPSRLNILWQGGASHYEDWYPLREELGKITKKYPHVHWLIWGQLYHWVTNLIPPGRFTFINWAPYQEYKLRLAMMNHDISLAPLSDTRFNRARSAIKFYEASVLRKDIPTLAQATGSYLNEIEDRKTGLLFKTPEEFGERLSELIENETLRKTIGANAKDWCHEHRDAMKETPKRFAFYEELREIQKREQPHMDDEDWDKFVKQVEEAEAAQQAEPQAVEA